MSLVVIRPVARSQMRMRGAPYLLLVLLVALAPLALAPLVGAQSSAGTGAPQLTHRDQTRPRIMSEAADLAAMPATAPALSDPPPLTLALSPAGRGSSPITAVIDRPRKEILGFVNAGSLGSTSVGYTTWNLSLLTTVAFFSLHVNSGDGALVHTDTGWNVWTSTTLRNFVSAAHAAGTRVIVSLNLHDFSTSPTNQVCQGLISTNATNTINEIRTQVSAAGIDGININYEGQDTVCANGLTARTQLVSFAKNLRAAMPAGTYIVIDTYGGSAEDNLEFFDITGLAPYVDAFFVMAYDMDVDNAVNPPLNCPSYCTNPVSPLNTYRFNVSKSIAQYSALVPARQVILGQPYYGRRGCVANLTDAHQLANNVGSTTYGFAVNTATESGVSNLTSHRDPSDGVSEWDTFHDSTAGINCNRTQSWDDVVSLGAKYDLVNSTGIGGVGIFTLDYAGGPAPELWNSLAAHFTCPGTNFMIGNFKGDGKASLAVIGSQTVCVIPSTGTSFSIPTPWASIPFYGSVATLAGDVTGSGKAALVAVNAGQTFVLPSTGTAFGPVQGWASVPFYGTRGTFLADVNGDGKADLVAINDTSVWVMLSTGTGFGPPTQWSNTPFYGNVTTMVGDVNGDLKADLVAVNSGSTWVMTSTGTGFAAPAQWSNQPFYGNITTMVGNVTGSGKAGLIALNSGSSWVMTSTGTGFTAPAQWSGMAFYGQQANLLGDANGDLKVDLVAVNYLSVWVQASTGTGFSPPAQWLTGPP